MINILQDNTECKNLQNLTIGVNRFEIVWEKLIDFLFGNEDKTKYFPHAHWYIFKNGSVEESSALEPDSIMKIDDKYYVLDAKYYQFGVTGDPNDLPATSSIQKQITYGKYIAEHYCKDSEDSVCNAFIMPFHAADNEKIKFVGIGTADKGYFQRGSLLRTVVTAATQQNQTLQLFGPGQAGTGHQLVLAAVDLVENQRVTRPIHRLLDGADDFAEKGVAHAAHHKSDGVGLGLDQITGAAVGDIVDFIDHIHHLCTYPLADVGVVIENPGHCADRYAAALGNIFDGHLFSPQFKLPET
jgi:hypothetical protein